MSIFSRQIAVALALAALALGGRAAHAQSGPLTYWIPGGPFGFGGGWADQNWSTYGDFPSFDGSAAQDRFSYVHYNSPNGWFLGSEGGGLGLNGIGPGGPFGSLYYEGTQFGYNFQNSGGLPVRVYAGFDTLKYNPGIGGPFASFDSASSTTPGYAVHAGVEIKPTSNVSLSFGVGYTQQSGDVNSLLLPGASPLAAGGIH